MLTNVPNESSLDEVSLRLYFDAWERSYRLIDDFAQTFDQDSLELDGEHEYSEEWNDYVAQAQSEMGAICATIQQSAELRLKSIICGVSPMLLLLNGSISFKSSRAQDLDFSEQRTLDAVDLPNAVRTLTNFELTESYVEHYGNMRRLRNQIIHLGSHKGWLSPYQMIEILGQQYVSLWQDGRWLYRRVQFDGNSARRFFHDQRYSSVESNVMAELPFILDILDNATFRTAVGVAKGKIKGFCPSCMYARATKWDASGHATAFRTSSTAAKCAMCERDLTIHISNTGCKSCGAKTFVQDAIEANDFDILCFLCGDS